MRKLKILTIIISIIIFCGTYPAEAFYPDLPKDIAVTFTNDSLTEKNFAWITTDLSKSQAIVVVKEVGGKQQKVFTGTTEIVTGRHDFFYDKARFNDAGNMFQFKVNKVTATGLKPNTRYSYYCGDGNTENWGATRLFETGSATGDFTFLYMTDSQCSLDNIQVWQKSSMRAHAKFPDAKFAVISGDLTDRGSAENYWDGFFEYGNGLLSDITIVPAIGNHETDMGPNTFGKHFNFPANEYALPDYVYSFDFGNAHFMVLSTEKTYAELTSKDEKVNHEANLFVDSQISWLRNEVSKSHQKWNIVIFHKGIYSGGKYLYADETLFYRNKLAPIFDELSIDVVLQGHNHTFDRSFLYEGKTVPPLTPESTAVTKTRGTLYLTANTAGSKFYIESAAKPAFLLKHSQPMTQLYTGVTVTADSMTFDTYAVTSRAEDALYDTFTINKK